VPTWLGWILVVVVLVVAGNLPSLLWRRRDRAAARQESASVSA
jgi:hypothetical protein